MFDETALSIGKLRKLNALRKSLGRSIADEVFAKWLAQPVESPESDRDAAVLSEPLWNLVQEGRLSIRRGGHLVRRGRIHVIFRTSRGLIVRQMPFVCECGSSRVRINRPKDAGMVHGYRRPRVLSSPSEPMAREIR